MPCRTSIRHILLYLIVNLFSAPNSLPRNPRIYRYKSTDTRNIPCTKKKPGTLFLVVTKAVWGTPLWTARPTTAALISATSAGGVVSRETTSQQKFPYTRPTNLLFW
jgi:hypothetical protein